MKNSSSFNFSEWTFIQENIPLMYNLEKLVLRMVNENLLKSKFILEKTNNLEIKRIINEKIYVQEIRYIQLIEAKTKALIFINEMKANFEDKRKDDALRNNLSETVRIVFPNNNDNFKNLNSPTEFNNENVQHNLIKSFPQLKPEQTIPINDSHLLQISQRSKKIMKRNKNVNEFGNLKLNRNRIFIVNHEISENSNNNMEIISQKDLIDDWDREWKATDQSKSSIISQDSEIFTITENIENSCSLNNISVNDAPKLKIHNLDNFMMDKELSSNLGRYSQLDSK